MQPSRAIAGSLWFLTVLVGWEILWSLAGVPRLIGPALGLLAMVFVVSDPVRLIWRSSVTPRAMAMDQRKASLTVEHVAH